jgi:heme/copper-type cytochrome/quinol oxidase subunit 2
VFAGISLAALGIAALLLAPLFQFWSSGVTQKGPVRIVNIQASMDGFDITEIRARAGETIVVNLRSLDGPYHLDGGGQHQFAIDELGINLIAPPLSVRSVTFTVTRPGVYVFYCDICCGGRANPRMVGRLIVEG